MTGYKRHRDKRFTIWTRRIPNRPVLIEIHNSNQAGDSIAIELDAKEEALVNALVRSVTARNKEYPDVVY